MQCSAVQYSTVQYSSVQYSAVQYSKLQYSTVQWMDGLFYYHITLTSNKWCPFLSTDLEKQYSAVQYSKVQYSAVQCKATNGTQTDISDSALSEIKLIYQIMNYLG